MARALSEDLRGRVLAAVVGGDSARSAARRFGVGASTAVAWAARYRQTGETSARPMGRGRGSRLDRHEAWVRDVLEDEPDLSLAELGERLRNERALQVGPARLCTWLRAKGLTRKKRPGTRPSRTVRTS